MIIVINKISEYVTPELKDLRENVKELKFLPKECGKKLAVGFIDGFISIFDLIISVKFDYQEIFKFSTSNSNLEYTISSFSFNKNIFESLTIAVGYSVKVF